jgi:hypothetical protein
LILIPYFRAHLMALRKYLEKPIQHTLSKPG